MTDLVWFRNDLRLEDHPALTSARAAGPALGLYIVSPAQWREHDEAPVKIEFWRRLLKDLSPRLAMHGVALKLLRVDRWDDVPAALLHFCQTHGIKRVHCNREQAVNERRRDRACFLRLREHDIKMIAHDGQTLLPPGELKTGGGDTYRVFTPFARACRARLASTGIELSSTPQPLALPTGVAPDDIDEVWPDALPSLAPEWSADHQVIYERLNTFAQNHLREYDQTRDFPAQPGTSRLSPYLAAGAVSAKQCLSVALAANHGEFESGNVGIRSWINELIWREFYWHLLHGYPQLSMKRPLRLETEAVVWRDAKPDFEAWAQGRTGIPIVDSAMKQLVTTGWMHNRLRMIVAMFLTKNLLIDWRLGERFFMQHLIDGELAANNGGWQWSASTGADAAPYFRVFNPVTQSQRFDPDGTFIRQWLPELNALDHKTIHDPSVEQRQRTGYPQAIVDLKASRLRAIDAFKRLSA